MDFTRYIPALRKKPNKATTSNNGDAPKTVEHFADEAAWILNLRTGTPLPEITRNLALLNAQGRPIRRLSHQ